MLCVSGAFRGTTEPRKFDTMTCGGPVREARTERFIGSAVVGSGWRGVALAVLAAVGLGACGEASTASTTGGAPKVVLGEAPSPAPDRWLVRVKRQAASDAGASSRVVAEKLGAIDGRTLRVDGFTVTEGFLPPGEGPMYLHAVALAGETPVAVADGFLGAGSGDAVEITAVAYDPACDADGDTYRDCGNVAAQCCVSIPNMHRGALGDCLDDATEIPSPERPDLKRRSAVDATPFAPTESSAEYLLCDNDVDDDCDGGDVACDDTDGDGDGFTVATDCNDAEGTINPEAHDTPGDGVDSDCNGDDGTGTDMDGDGWFADDPDPAKRDCDDGNVGVHPRAGEVSCDAIDQDCDGEAQCVSDGEMADLDGDGALAGDADPAKRDCDDHDAGRHPGAEETCGDAVDQDCDGSDLACDPADTDKDGHVGAEDCNEGDPSIHADAAERCGNDVDENCDGQAPSCSDVQDRDGDGFPLPWDCDDRDDAVGPGAPERCNNRDDDCDGVVDEGNPRLFDGDPVPHPETCGRDEGACRMGPLVCAHGADGTVFDLCLGDMGTAEICDGFDNDCDGLTDVLNGGAPLPDEGQGVCGPAMERGACRQGRLFCQGGTLSDCRDAVMPSEEICDGLDNDCDGQIDIGPGGEPVFERCYGGAAGTSGLGECREGIRRCVEGQFSACEGEVTPQAEVCDALDNDCNGAVDDEIDVPCWDFDPSIRGVGACRDGRRACVDGMLGACENQVGPEAEICDGLDNNCDRVIDQFSEACYDADPALDGVGVCRSGLRVCNNGAFSACMGQILPSAEICNSQDDDCDGQPDETFDFASDPLHCGSCDVACGAGQDCCNRACRSVNTLQNCGGCGIACSQGADGCRDVAGGGLQCACGNGPACEGGLRCVGGACVCQRNEDCGDNALCCAGRCEPTDPGPDGQCAACDDGGCDPAVAQTCTDRECRCGENTACQAGVTVCGQRNGQGDFLCLGCRTNGQCGENERCCDEVCTSTDADFQCEACGQPCDRNRADTCVSVPAADGHAFECSCGAGGTPCDPAGELPWCVGGTCEECRFDADCLDPARGQCVDNVCRACDPSDQAGCGANDICCGFQCQRTGPNANQQCQACGVACDVETTDSCTGRSCRCGNNPPCSGGTAHCDDARDTCVECLVDAHCVGDPDGGQCVNNVCRACDPNGHDGCVANQVCCGAGLPGVYRCEATGPGAGDQCEACDAACDTEATNACTGRDCQCGANQPCAGNTPVCHDPTGRCVECVDDQDCGGRPGGGQCVDFVCRPCDPGDHAGCAGDQLCCNFQCQATGGGAGQQCESCGSTCGSAADTCRNRNCVCGAGAGAVECAAPTGLCINGACRQCQNNNQCGPNELCCNNACTPTGAGPAQQCAACNTACTQSNSNLCEGRSCRCGNNPACAGGTPVCDDANGRCVQCLADGDCPNNGQCVANVCQVCDPADHAGCAANQLCCNGACVATGGGVGESCSACGNSCPQDSTSTCTNRVCRCGNNAACGGQTPFCNDAPGMCTGCRNDGDCNGQQCVAGACRACDPSDDAGCVATGNTPVCGANFQCRACGNDGECSENPTGAFCNSVVGRCRRCNEASDAPCDLITPICDEVDNRCEDCIGDQGCIDRPGNENQCVNGDCRLCDPQGNAGCTANSNTPVCSNVTFTCRGCAADADCTGNPEGGVCDLATGRCGDCDPGRNACPAATPICDSGSLSCRGCAAGAAGDAECAPLAGDADQCVAGRCRACDPGDDAGCAEGSASPICDAASFTCRTCAAGAAGDTECNDHPGSLDQCVAGRCRACDPGDDAGCAENAAAPICDGASFTCRACAAGAAGDTECLDHPGSLDQCSGGRCRACDPTDDSGCAENGASPICDGASFTCRACQAPGGAADPDQECIDHPGGPALNQCVAGRCRGCDPADDEGCTLSDIFPTCSAQSFSCVACAGDDDCSANPNGTQCVASGACKVCDPVQSDGCTENSATPICDGSTYACRACAADAPGDAECDTRTGGLNECVAGRCRGCDPGNNADCDPQSAVPICDAAAFSCRACNVDAECGGGTPECVATGACGACDPEGNVGCGPATATPICEDATNTCRACQSDPECAGNASGEICIGAGGDAGECHVCDPVDDAGCGADVCVNDVCTNCAANADCTGNGNGSYCNAGDCVQCLITANCNGGRICTMNTCQPCAVNADCTGHPDGNLCDLMAMGGAACRACADNADCRSHGFPANSTCDPQTHVCSN
jgi:hypothetical protein